ncbi:MAG: serine/threonine-protein kinase [Planctomycetota bacterium]|jgi:serine/threonine-protein kinase
MFDDDTIDDDLDAGLRAAFGETVTAPDAGAGGGVIAGLEARLGFQSRVLLRDDGEEGRVVRPRLPGREEPAGRYEIHGEVARGGVGVILKGRDADLGRDIAMKVLQERHTGNAALVQRFVEEAQIAGQLQHPGILPVYELGLQADQRPYFTMKLVKGRTLAALLADRAGPADDRARLLSIFEHVCQTIAYAHSRGVIHRDLKPSNVMVGAFGEVQVVDWGLAKVLAAGGTTDDRRHEVPPEETEIRTARTAEPGSRSLAGSVMGTPAYIAPEQARGETDALDERTDVFALGGVLCEILSGLPPFTGDADAMLDAASAGRLGPAFARLDACGADAELIAIARSCLAPDPADRPASAPAVAQALTEHLASVERRARDAEIAAAEAATRAQQERRARRLVIALAGAILLALVIGAGALFGFERERAARAVEVAAALESASVLFGEAKAAPVGDDRAWDRLIESATNLEILSEREIDRSTRDRVEQFLAEVAVARRDRAMLERIEQLVIYGATHEDPESWIWMEQELREAYIDYGIDLDNASKAEIARQIAASPLMPQLANGLELWIATVFHLGTLDANPRSIAEMMSWVKEVLYVADRDPLRTGIRKLLYTPDPSVHLEEIEKLRNSEAFRTALPTTMSWLASTYWRAGDPAAGSRVFDEALEDHPGDVMLNFDAAYFLVAQGKWNEATRYYHRALAVRPDSGGIWRSLGTALYEFEDYPAALDAYDQSIRYQADYAPTHVERGVTLAAMERYDDAIASHDEALRLSPDSALAHCQRGRTLQAAGRLDEALAALERGHELGSAKKYWTEPSDEWIAECRRLIEERNQ